MTQELLRHLLDACFYGKQITELMPPLPQNIKPRHIHVLDTIHMLQERQKDVRISDVSAELRVTTPSVTKLIQELETYGAVEKRGNKEDKRITNLILTPLGLEYYARYIKDYHEKLAEILTSLDEQECEATVRTLEKMYHLMKARPIEITKQ